MIYIFGDSHARFNFSNLSLVHQNWSQNSVTMHRIGRDGAIPLYNEAFSSLDNIFIFCYGEIDCRCHIGKQLALNERSLVEIIDELANKYFETLILNVKKYKKIIICNITPPLRREEFEDIHGPITHEFPFVGTNKERVFYTRLLNKKLEELCQKYSFVFFDVYNDYCRDDGTLMFEKSDEICHIKENQLILERFVDLMKTI